MADLIIFSIVGMYSFHCAYKGLATRNTRVSMRYVGLQLPLMVFVFLSMLLGVSNFNGWMNLRRAEDSDAMNGFSIAIYKVPRAAQTVDGREPEASRELLRSSPLCVVGDYAPLPSRVPSSRRRSIPNTSQTRQRRREAWLQNSRCANCR